MYFNNKGCVRLQNYIYIVLITENTTEMPYLKKRHPYFYIYKAKGSRTKFKPTCTLQALLLSKFSSIEIKFYKALYVCWCSIWARKVTSHSEGRNTRNVPENRMLRRLFGCKIFWSVRSKGGTSLPATIIIKWRKFITISKIYFWLNYVL